MGGELLIYKMMHDFSCVIKLYLILTLSNLNIFIILEGLEEDPVEHGKNGR